MATPPPTSLRLTDDVLDRAERLVPSLQSDPVLQAVTPQVTRTAVLRLALLKGLEVLESQHQQTSPAASPARKAAPRRR